MWSRGLVDGDRVYFGDFDGNLYAVSLANGSELWSVKLGKGPIRASPTLAGGLLIVSTERGWLLGVDPSTQTARWEKKIGASLNADLVKDGDDVLIAPSGCVTEGAGETKTKTYYASVDPATGDLRAAGGVC